MQNNIENAIDLNAANIGGEEYDSTSTYYEGDTCIYNSVLYRAKQDIDTPEEWTAAHWEETSLINELANTSGNEVLVSDDEEDITRQTKLFINSDTGLAKYRDGDDFYDLQGEEIVYGDSNITSNSKAVINESEYIPYINSEIAIGSTNPYNQRTWFKQGKNLINLATITEGIRINTTGADYADASYFATDYIAVIPNTNYVVNYTMANVYRMAFYDSTKTFISANTTDSSFVTPSNCVYIRLGQLITNENSVMLEKGSTSTTYEAYVSPSIIIDNEEIYNKANLDINEMKLEDLISINDGYTLQTSNSKIWKQGKHIWGNIVISKNSGNYGTNERIGSLKSQYRGTIINSFCFFGTGLNSGSSGEIGYFYINNSTTTGYITVSCYSGNCNYLKASIDYVLP